MKRYLKETNISNEMKITIRIAELAIEIIMIID